MKKTYTIITHNLGITSHIPKDHAIKTIVIDTDVYLEECRETQKDSPEFKADNAAMDIAEAFMWENEHICWRVPELCSDKTTFEI